MRPLRLMLPVAALFLATLGASVAQAAVTLAVVPCAMTYGVEPGTPPVPPSSLRVAVPATLASSLRVFWSPHARMVGPAGLRCTGEEGADGILLLRALPSGGGRRGPGVTLYAVPACAGCIAQLACAYFPQAARLGLGGCHASIPTAERLLSRDANAVIFEDPAGVAGQGQGSGGRIPALSALIFRGGGRPSASMVTCRLSAARAALCRAVVREYRLRVGR
jgi:hypothetical protein